MNDEKKYIISGGIILVIGSIVLFFLELEKIHFLRKSVLNIFLLCLGILLIIYVLLLRNKVKGLIFILICILASMFFWNLYSKENNLGGIYVLGVGFPSGAITAILFLIINNYFFKNETNKKISFFVKLFFFVAIYAIVIFIMMRGGDVLFDLRYRS